MTPEQQAAHKRLLSILPVRTIGTPPMAFHGRTKQRRCIVKGKEYKTISEAALELNMARAAVWYWVKKEKHNSRYL